MNYRLIRSTKSLSERHRLLYPLLLLGLATSLHFLFPHFLTGAVAYVTRPIWRFEQALIDTGGNLTSFFSSKAALIDEVTHLTTELQKKDIQLLDRDVLAEENRILKETFGRSDTEKGIIASVLTTPPRSLYDTIVLDAGSFEGVRENAQVFVGSVALGKITRVTLHTSVAELYSTAGHITPMFILHNGISVPIEAEGRGGGEFSVVLPKETEVAVGDSVTLPGIKPMLFGKVDAIDSTITSSFQTIYIASPVHIQALRFVEINNYRYGVSL